MYNDINRQDVNDFFRSLIESDSRLTGLKDDLGVIALGNEMAYKIDDAVKRITNQFTEFYDPTTEAVLLSKLMYGLGYIRFQKPLVISADIKSGVDVTLDKHQRFTTGVDVFILDEAVSLVAGVPQTLTLTMGTKRDILATVDSSNFYFKIPLQASYKRLYDFNVYRGDEKLKYSQMFIEEDSDVTLEVELDGSMVVSVKTANLNGENILLGDNLRVEVFETIPSDDVPETLAIIGDFDIICENITKHSIYESYLSITQMQDILKYDKNINNSIVYNENYKNLIKTQVRGINLLKVWQQEQEDYENGALACNINKVFVSFLSDGVRGATEIEKEISNLVNDTVYGRYVKHISPVYAPLDVQIDITNNTKKAIPSVKLEEIQNAISGYYDDIDRVISISVIYKTVILILKGYDVDIDIVMTDKPLAKNATFYNISNVAINVTERQ